MKIYLAMLLFGTLLAAIRAAPAERRRHSNWLQTR
jgi:hypothetical protein